MSNEDTNFQLSPVLWVIAAIMFFGILKHDGIGGLANFVGHALGTMGMQNLNNNCVDQKNVLDAVIATSNAVKAEVGVVQTQNTANWYNTNKHMDDLYMKQQEDKARALELQLLQKDNQIMALQYQMQNQAEFNKINSKMDAMYCGMAKQIPIYAMGCLPAVGCTTNTSTTTSGSSGGAAA